MYVHTYIKYVMCIRTYVHTYELLCTYVSSTCVQFCDVHKMSDTYVYMYMSAYTRVRMYVLYVYE